jgi:hypothetical protein
MTIETKFSIDQEVFWHNKREETVEVARIDEISTNTWKGITGVTTSATYRLVPQQCWVSDYHLFADELSAVAEMEKWKRL